MVKKDEPIDEFDYTRIINRVLLLGSDGETLVNPQNPLPTDGDSLYCKDIDTINSDINNFSGDICDLVNNLKTLITDSTANNPKTLKIWFNRTIYAHDLGLGCDDLTKGFGTDITVKLLGSGEVVRFTKNFTGIDPNSALLEFGPKAFNGVILEFNTTNEVCVSNLTIRKAVETTSTIQALKPDGTITNIDATAGGNLKVSVEEISEAEPTAGYGVNDVDVPGTNVNYYGFENKDGKWYILKEDKTVTPNTYRYATGSSDYSTAWTNRTSQTYLTYSNAF